MDEKDDFGPAQREKTLQERESDLAKLAVNVAECKGAGDVDIEPFLVPMDAKHNGPKPKVTLVHGTGRLDKPFYNLATLVRAVEKLQKVLPTNVWGVLRKDKQVKKKKNGKTALTRAGVVLHYAVGDQFATKMSLPEAPGKLVHFYVRRLRSTSPTIGEYMDRFLEILCAALGIVVMEIAAEAQTEMKHWERRAALLGETGMVKSEDVGQHGDKDKQQLTKVFKNVDKIEQLAQICDKHSSNQQALREALNVEGWPMGVAIKTAWKQMEEAGAIRVVYTRDVKFTTYKWAKRVELDNVCGRIQLASGVSEDAARAIPDLVISDAEESFDPQKVRRCCLFCDSKVAEYGPVLCEFGVT